MTARIPRLGFVGHASFHTNIGYSIRRNHDTGGCWRQITPVTMQNQDAQKCQLEMPGFLTARNMSGGSLCQQIKGEQLASSRLSEYTMPQRVSNAGQMVFFQHRGTHQKVVGPKASAPARKWQCLLARSAHSSKSSFCSGLPDHEQGSCSPLCCSGASICLSCACKAGLTLHIHLCRLPVLRAHK